MGAGALFVIVGYIAGVAIGGRIAHDLEVTASVWPQRVNRVLMIELTASLAFAIGWEVAGRQAPARRRGGQLLLAASLAMGLRSAAVRALLVPGLSTTYLTGSLTSLVADLAHSGTTPGLTRTIEIFVAVILGASLGGWLVVEAPRAAPLVPLLALVSVVLVAARFERGD